MDIDLVYFWVNGNDPKWIAKRQAFLADYTENEESCKGRYIDNEELKYSLRSIEKYAPWIRRIFIVTDNQVPTWLNTSHSKIQIVDHSEIIPHEYLPCFNSRVIEHHMHKIPGLAEHFLYANDDMFFNKPVTPEDLFAKDSLPIIRMNRRFLKKWALLYQMKVRGKQLRNYKFTVHRSALLVEKKYGKYYSSRTDHNIEAYRKSDYAHAREVFEEEISATLSNRVRSDSDYHRNLYSYVALAEKRVHVCYVNQYTSFRLNIENRSMYEEFEKYNPTFFCMNDSQYANDEDRKLVAVFLNKLFPDKSQFEK